jgi:hypothetical protein
VTSRGSCRSGVFPATRENTGKNPVGARNRRNSSQIDPYNQVLASSFPVRLAGKNFPCQACRQGNGREKIRICARNRSGQSQNGLWIKHLHVHMGLLPQCRAGRVAGPPARPPAGRTDSPCSSQTSRKRVRTHRAMRAPSASAISPRASRARDKKGSGPSCRDPRIPGLGNR